MSSDPCQQPTMFFLDQATKVGKSGSITIYKRHEGNESKCFRSGTNNLELQRITVTALKLDPKYWKNVPRRYCCQLLGGGSIKNGNMDIRIKKCRSHETIPI
ncbi:hypothetical protein JHK85_006675 [Glycine max]|nr:hypothetical protein JHK85_006675 [Glycine max]KAG5071277.1 hypothetical protein JHK86_006488 [Glycine max]KAH1068779.1 hypothetical protein GYH30_006376 [Glycine max]